MLVETNTVEKMDAALNHGLSERVYRLTRNKKNRGARHGLEPILSGPLAVLTLPSVSPQHLKAALSILSPSKEFPAPKRRANPGYHEPAVQGGLQKLILLAARVEGKVFDMEGTRWVGGIEGGIDGLRGHLVAMLQGIGAGVTSTLEAASKSLYLTVEARRGMLEEQEKGSEQ
jgi:large subunit ribosomal protein L10